MELFSIRPPCLVGHVIWKHLLFAFIFMSTPLGGGHIIFAFSGVRRPSHLVFRSFQGKVFILCLPNLVRVFIGLIACMGLLLVKIAL